MPYKIRPELRFEVPEQVRIEAAVQLFTVFLAISSLAGNCRQNQKDVRLASSSPGFMIHPSQVVWRGVQSGRWVGEGQFDHFYWKIQKKGFTPYNAELQVGAVRVTMFLIRFCCSSSCSFKYRCGNCSHFYWSGKESFTELSIQEESGKYACARNEESVRRPSGQFKPIWQYTRQFLYTSVKPM